MARKIHALQLNIPISGLLPSSLCFYCIGFFLYIVRFWDFIPCVLIVAKTESVFIMNADWEFVKVYTDEGISGLNTKHREGFNEMIRDALDGKIDLIVTKSVSRFARNTVDSLTTIRKLKDAGCECYF